MASKVKIMNWQKTFRGNLKNPYKPSEHVISAIRRVTDTSYAKPAKELKILNRTVATVEVQES